VIAATLFTGFASADDDNAVYQSIQVGITQQNQLFEYNDADNTEGRLRVWGQRAQYQVGKGPWILIMDYHQAQASNSSNLARYQLDFKSKSAGVFIEYYLEHLWLALGYNQSKETTEYNSNNKSQIDYQNYSLESGYIHYTQSGQWAATWGLTQQYVEDETSGDQISNSQMDENGILTNLTVSYGHFYPLSENFQLALNAGLRREFTLSGDGRIQQSTRNQGPSNNNQAQPEDLQSTTQSASTSQQAQISLQHKKGSISLNVDKLSDQSFANSYFGASISAYF
jgi:hypothetical protein